MINSNKKTKINNRNKNSSLIHSNGKPLAKDKNKNRTILDPIRQYRTTSI